MKRHELSQGLPKAEPHPGDDARKIARSAVVWLQGSFSFVLVPGLIRRWNSLRALLSVVLPVLVWFAVVGHGFAQTSADSAGVARAERFLAGRTTADGSAAASAMGMARAQQLELIESTPAAGTGVQARMAKPRVTPLSTAWTAVGPAQIASQRYGLVTGRVTSVAIDPADPTGNTVYLGTTGGGVWKSTNAAGPAANVSFVPLTDTLPVFSANAGTAALPSLSIGAVSVGNGVVLAGTGDPNDALDSYYGEGILRSADGGATWTLIQKSNDGVAGNHFFLSMGVAGFAWSTTNPSLVVAAFSDAAEGWLVGAPHRTDSVMGLYYSTDAGATWHMGVLMDGSQTVQAPTVTTPGQIGNAATSVVWNAMRGRFYAAVRFHGYYESYDGVTWTRVTHQPGAGLTTAACPVIVLGTNCPIFRGALAVDVTSGDTYAFTVNVNNVDQGIWRDVCGGNGGPCPTQSIAFGTQLNSGPLETDSAKTIAQGDYDLALAAVRTGSGTSADTLLFAGTTDLYRCSIAAGCTFRNTTNALNGCAAPARVAPAQHAVAALANAGTSGDALVYVGNDGGLWRSIDGVNQLGAQCSGDDATHFEDLNGGLGSLAEVVSFAQDPSDPAVLLAGVGANGTAMSPAPGSGSVAWPQLTVGEGGSVAIDQANAANWYVSTEDGVSERWCGRGTACTATDFSGTPTIGYAQVNNDASLIAPPLLLDPALSNDVLIGTCRVWRGAAQDGTLWPASNEISPDLGGAQNTTCSAANGMVRSLGAGGPASGSGSVQNAGSTVIYAGMAGGLDGGLSVGGHVFANYAAGRANATTAWTDLANSAVTNDPVNGGLFNPGGFDVSSLAVDAHDSTGETVYATIMGFSVNGVYVPHVYRSADGGAHWTDISSNLPNVPANAVVVDPNNANTVYVAMDTGVYVTTAVTGCGSADCWSVYGTGLPNAPVTTLAVSASMPTGDGRIGELRAGTYGRGIWSIPMVNAAVPVLAAMTPSPGSLSFSAQAVSTASAAQTITVTNSGAAVLLVSRVVTSGDYVQTNTCVSATGVAPGANCTVTVQFLPTATGSRAGVLTLYGNVAGGQGSVALSGTALPPAAVVLTPIQVSFASTNLGAASGAQNITVSNTGGVSATLGTPVVSGDFVISGNTCGTSLAAGTGCTVSVVFKPAVPGVRTGALTLTGSTGTLTASLTGTGVLPATDGLAPLVLTFGQQVLSSASTAQSVTLTNNGDAALQLIAAQITTGDFTVVNGCGNSLSGHASCTMQVAFVPKSIGAETGVLTIGDQYRSQAVALSGVGLAPAGVSLSPLGTVSFGAAGVGASSAAQTVTLTNNGGLPLTIQAIAVTGDFAIQPGSTTCGAVLAAGAACTMQVVFTPSAGGARNGTVSVADNAAGSPQSVALTGTGVDFSLAANGSTAATVSAGQQAVYPLLLSSAANVPGMVTFTCAPLPASTTCTVTPANASLGSTTNVSVTIATSVQTAALDLPGTRRTLWFAGIVPLGLMLVPRRRARRLALLSAVLMMGGCSASRLIPATTTGPGATSTTSPTPAGTYNVTVTGTSAGLTRSVGLTLIVR